MKSSASKDLVIAVCFAAVGAFVLPFQTYLANADLYDFSFLRALAELAGLFVVFALVAFLLLRLIGRYLFGCLQAFFVAVTVCVYLECGILSLGLPEINGGFVRELDNQGRCLFDACVWSILLFVFLATVRWTRSYLQWIAAAVLLLTVASLFDVKKASAPTSVTNETGFCNQMTVVANVKYSPTRNVLVFILDSMPGKIAFDVLAKRPECLAKFTGFCGYPRNIGMHECTKRGMPGIATGRYYDPDEMSQHEYPMTMYGTNSFVIAARDLGWNISFSPDLLPYGYTNLPIIERVARVEKRRARDAFGFLRQSTDVPFLSLFDTVAFRYAPFYFKGPILYSRIRHAVKGRHSMGDFWGEQDQYRRLAERPLDDSETPFLGVFHTVGVHPPWSKPFGDVVLELMDRLGDLMDTYRAKGFYDKSLIIVTSDHGLDEVPPLEGYPSSASAFLMVKPVGAKEPFAVSDLRTSHARIAPLVRAALAEPLDEAACKKILSCEKPLYRAEVHEGGHLFFRDWPAK